MNIKFAERLTELRKKKGLSQEQLAELLGVSRQAVSKWERAEATPDLDNLILLSRLYEISLDELVKEESERKEDSSNAQILDDKDEIRISSEGIEIKSSDEVVKITSDQIKIETQDKKKERHKVSTKIGNLVSVIYLFFAFLGFLLMGFLLENGWYYSWAFLVSVPVVMSFFTALEKKKVSDFCYPVLIVIIYCLVGVLSNIWHPTWVIFLTIPLFYIISSPLDEYLLKKNEKLSNY